MDALTIDQAIAEIADEFTLLPDWEERIGHVIELARGLAPLREAERNEFDPMFAAGLIRQESTFQADAVSHANAIGLMQILPKTGRLLAKQRKVKYNRNSLFDPEINIELGMLCIADLTRATGAPEYAAAAYNAGEDRIAAWKAERNYEEIPELVEGRLRRRNSPAHGTGRLCRGCQPRAAGGSERTGSQLGGS